jgi:hypothetical protein
MRLLKEKSKRRKEAEKKGKEIVKADCKTKRSITKILVRGSSLMECTMI